VKRRKTEKEKEGQQEQISGCLMLPLTSKAAASAAMAEYITRGRRPIPITITMHKTHKIIATEPVI
jgi:hypothetical protein